LLSCPPYLHVCFSVMCLWANKVIDWLTFKTISSHILELWGGVRISHSCLQGLSLIG